jgi:hypothetical protein
MSVIQAALSTALLDLPLALHCRLFLNSDSQVHLAGRSGAIAPTHRETVGTIKLKSAAEPDCQRSCNQPKNGNWPGAPER